MAAHLTHVIWLESALSLVEVTLVISKWSLQVWVTYSKGVVKLGPQSIPWSTKPKAWALDASRLHSRLLFGLLMHGAHSDLGVRFTVYRACPLHASVLFTCSSCCQACSAHLPSDKSLNALCDLAKQTVPTTRLSWVPWMPPTKMDCLPFMSPYTSWVY